MKIIHKKIYFTLLLSIIILGFFALKYVMPLSYAEEPINKEALDYVLQLQQGDEQNPTEVAKSYYSFGKSDLQEGFPAHIQTIGETLDDGTVQMTILDPHCRDDSISKTIDRIYLIKNKDGLWEPIKHDWAHKGRGFFGWTTKLTI